MKPNTPLNPNKQRCSQVFLKEILLPCKILTELDFSRQETIICELGKNNGFFFPCVNEEDINKSYCLLQKAFQT